LSRSQIFHHCAHQRATRWVRPFAGYCWESWDDRVTFMLFFFKKRVAFMLGSHGEPRTVRVISEEESSWGLVVACLGRHGLLGPQQEKEWGPSLGKKYWRNFTEIFKILSLSVRSGIFYLSKISSLSTPQSMQIALFAYTTMIIYRLKPIYSEFVSIIFKSIKFCSPKLLIFLKFHVYIFLCTRFFS
jgi:hypothetical protein